MVYSRQEMRNYGYTRDNDMIAMDYLTAQALYDVYLPNIYILFSDSTAKLIEYETEFEANTDKMFGILACQAFPAEQRVLLALAQRGCNNGLLESTVSADWIQRYKLRRY